MKVRRVEGYVAPQVTDYHRDVHWTEDIPKSKFVGVTNFANFLKENFGNKFVKVTIEVIDEE